MRISQVTARVSVTMSLPNLKCGFLILYEPFNEPAVSILFEGMRSAIVMPFESMTTLSEDG